MHNGTAIEGKVFEYKEDKKIYSCRIDGGHLVSVPHSVCFPKTEMAAFLNSCMLELGNKENAKEDAPKTPDDPKVVDEAKTLLWSNFSAMTKRVIIISALALVMLLEMVLISKIPNSEGPKTESGSGETVEMQAARRVNERNIRLMSPSPLPLEQACRERNELLEQNKADVSIMLPNK